MGASLWDQVGLPLLIGVAIQIVVTALCFLSARLWNCLMKQIKTQTAAGESAHDQPFPDSDAAAPANGVPDLEMGNGSGPAEGGQSTAEPELELRIVNDGEAPKAQVMRVAARGALVPVEMDVPHSQKEEVLAHSARSLALRYMNEAPVEKVVKAGHDCCIAPEAFYGSPSILFLLTWVKLLLILHHANPDDPTSLSHTAITASILEG